MIKPNAVQTTHAENYPFGGLIHFYSRTSEKYSILNLEPLGTLSLYNVTLSVGTNNPLELVRKNMSLDSLLKSASLHPLYEWSLQRCTKWPTYHFFASRKKRSTEDENDIKEEGDLQHSSLMGNQNKPRPRSDSIHTIWLSNIETLTCTKSHTPFWLAGDLFPLQGFQAITRH